MLKYWNNNILMTKEEIRHIRLLRVYGCNCELPLLGYNVDVGPRCRLCNTQAKDKGK